METSLAESQKDSLTSLDLERNLDFVRFGGDILCGILAGCELDLL